jgi:transposase-like protein
MVEMPKSPWRRHSPEFKKQAVERMKSAENIQALARELQIERKLLYIWKHQLEGRPEPRHADLSIDAEERRHKRLETEVAKLKSALADKTLENDFFKSALFKIKEARQKSTGTGASASTATSDRGSQNKAH